MSRPRWTLTEAAKHVGVSRSTLRRRLDEGSFKDAYQDARGVWRIPLEDLLAAGYAPVSGGVSDSTTDLSGEPYQRPSDLDQGRINELEQRLRAAEMDLSAERAQRTALEQVAAAERRRADSLEKALLMLEAAPKFKGLENERASDDGSPAQPSPSKPPSKRWWHLS